MDKITLPQNKSTNKKNTNKGHNHSIIRAFIIVGFSFIVIFFIVRVMFPTEIVNRDPKFHNKKDEGFYIFYQLLEKLDYKIKATGEKEKLLKSSSVMIYTSESTDILSNNKKEKDPQMSILRSPELHQWVERGNDLVLIGSESIDQYYGNPFTGTTKNSSTIILFKSLTGGDCTHFKDYQYKSEKVFYPLFLKRFKESKLTLLGESESDEVSVAQIQEGAGTVLLIAEGDFFSNINLKDLHYAYLLDALFSPYKNKKIYLIRKPVKLIPTPSIGTFLFSGRHVVLVVHSLIMFLLFLYLAGKRFARPEILLGKKQRESTEHTRAVGIFYQRGQAFSLIEKIDSEYFKTMVCLNKKPNELTPDEYEEFTREKKSISVKEIYVRFWQRTQLRQKKTRRRKK